MLLGHVGRRSDSPAGLSYTIAGLSREFSDLVETVVSVEGFNDIALGERRRPRRRVVVDLSRRLEKYLFEVFGCFVGEFRRAIGPIIVVDNLLDRLIGDRVESA